MNPDTIRSQRFLLVRRGYDPEAVLGFLDEVADALAAVQSSDRSSGGDPSESAVEVADARRLVDEARTRAATHRLRAQRDIEALERTARSRRARLVGEIEELATARDQLSDDLDRAVDVVDRVVQWVRRTDPAAAPTGPVADVGAPDLGPVGDADPEPDGASEPDHEVPESEAPDDQARESETDDAVDVMDEGHGTGEEVDPVAEAAIADVIEEGAEDGPEPIRGESDTGESDTGESDDEPDDDQPGAAEPDPDEPGVTPADPATAAVRAALRDVQDEVLGNLRDQPRAGVDAWVPASSTLLALDDAATAASARAFHDGWAMAGGDEPSGDAPEGAPQEAPHETSQETSRDAPGSATARDALEEVRGAGAMPGLGIADDLRVAIRASLQRGVDAGDATPQLVERLAEVHRDTRQTRLDPALDDVLGSARHHGMVRRWAHDGVGAVRWVLGEERRCPGRRCRANATDGVVEPGAPFAWGELVPPAHPGCTCTLEPVDPDPAGVEPDLGDGSAGADDDG